MNEQVVYFSKPNKSQLKVGEMRLIKENLGKNIGLATGKPGIYFSVSFDPQTINYGYVKWVLEDMGYREVCGFEK